MANETNGTNTGAATATKKAPARLKEPMSDRAKYAALPEDEKVNFMTDAEQAAFEKLTEGKRTQYGIRLENQKNNDKLKALRSQDDKDRAERKVTAEREKGIKQIITDIRKDELAIDREGGFLTANAPIASRLTALGITAEDALAVSDTVKVSIFERIKTESAKATSSRLLPMKPAYVLGYELLSLKKADFIEPTDGGRPDLTTANNLRKFGFIAPLLVAPAKDAEGNAVAGKYSIMDGKRRYFVMDDEENYPAVAVTGFPDTVTEEKAEVMVNRVRNLNILSTAQTLTGMRARGIEDTEIRRDMGFKTGEVDKIISITDLADGFQEAIKAGAITPTVALSIAKLPKALRQELLKGYKARLKENANSRISEMDVNNIRQARAADAANRDAGTLGNLADNAPAIESPKVDETAKAKVGSKTDAAPKAKKK